MRRWIWAFVAVATLSCRGNPDRDLPAEYRDIAVPREVVDSPASRAKGAEVFSMHCAFCHGSAGNGHGVRASFLSTAPRDFTDRAWQKRTTDRHIYFAIREGVRGTPMPSWRSLSETETWELVGVIRSFG